MGYNDFSSRAQTVNAAVLPYLRKYAGLSAFVRQDFDDKLVPSGSIIHMEFAPNISAQAFTPSPSGTNAPVASPTVVNLSLDQLYEAPFTIDDVSAFGNEELIAQYAVSAMEGLMTQVELDLYQKAGSGSDNGTHFTQINSSSEAGVGSVNSKGTALISLTGSLNLVRAARNNLNNNKVPRAGRVLLLGVNEYGNFLGNTSLQKINEGGEPSILREGLLSFSKMGFEVHETQFQLNSTPSGTVNVAFHRDALLLCARPVLMNKPGQRVANIRDPISRFPFQYVEWDQQGQTRFAIVAQWGSRVLRDSHAVVIYG